MSNIGENIKNSRLKMGLSQEQLAAIIGVRKATISRYENGTREPRNEQLKTIAKALKVSAAYLQGYEPITDHLTESAINLQAIIDCINTNYDEITYMDRLQLIDLIQIFAKLNDYGQDVAISRLQDIEYFAWYRKKTPQEESTENKNETPQE